MRNAIPGIALATSPLAASATAAAAQAPSGPGLIFGVNDARDAASLESVRYVWGGGGRGFRGSDRGGGAAMGHGNRHGCGGREGGGGHRGGAGHPDGGGREDGDGKHRG